MKVERAVPSTPHGLCGRKASFEEKNCNVHRAQELCVKVEVAVLGSPESSP